MSFNSDSNFYRNDGAVPPPATNPDLSSQISYDGRRASSPNTGSRYLTQVGIDDSTATRPTVSERPCEWINTKFNANKNGSYEVTIRDGNIYIKNEDGQERISTPQQYHPANRDESYRRDSNYYNDQSYSYDGQYRPPYRPQQEAYYPREQYYPQAQPYGYERPQGLNVGSLILGGVIGALIGGHRHGGGGYDYNRYHSAPIGYVPGGYSPVNYNYSPQNYNYNYNYNYNPQNYNYNTASNYNGDGSYYGSNNGYMPTYGPTYRRYNYNPRSYASNDTYQNPQYTSGDYPGDNLYNS